MDTGISLDRNTNSVVDKKHIDTHNCFRTECEAREKFLKVKEILKEE